MGTKEIGTAVDDGEHVLTLARLDEAMAAETPDLEATVIGEPAQATRDPPVGHRVLRHGVNAGLERVVVTERHRRGRIVAIEDCETAARSQDPECLGERGRRVGDV